MARGFESKSVQEQWLDAEAAQQQRSRARVDRQEIERQKERQSLELSRSRVARELHETKSDLRRNQLQAALDHLDRQLKRS